MGQDSKAARLAGLGGMVAEKSGGQARNRILVPLFKKHQNEIVYGNTKEIQLIEVVQQPFLRWHIQVDGGKRPFCRLQQIVSAKACEDGSHRCSDTLKDHGQWTTETKAVRLATWYGYCGN